MTTPPPQAYTSGAMPAVGAFRPLKREEPKTRFWFSDREIGTPTTSRVTYTSDDFRNELARVERRLYWLTIVSVVIAIVAVVAIIGVIIQAG